MKQPSNTKQQQNDRHHPYSDINHTLHLIREKGFILYEHIDPANKHLLESFINEADEYSRLEEEEEEEEEEDTSSLSNYQPTITSSIANSSYVPQCCSHHTSSRVCCNSNNNLINSLINNSNSNSNNSNILNTNPNNSNATNPNSTSNTSNNNNRIDDMNSDIGGFDSMIDDSIKGFFDEWEKNSIEDIKKRITKKKDCSITDTLSMSDLLQDLLDIYVTCKLPKSNMRKIFELFNKYKVASKRVPTLDTVIERVHNVNEHYEKHFYCSKHEIFLKEASCSECAEKTLKGNSKQHVKHFWTRSIVSCISAMVDKVGLQTFRANLTNNQEQSTTDQNMFITDCTDSNEYKRLTKDWYDNDTDTLCLTISAGTDGGSVSKSNSKSINPLFFWINEIDLKHRFAYPLTSLTAYANHKIPYHILLYKFVDELCKLYDGVNVVTKKGYRFTLKVLLFQMIVDLVAAKDLLRINGHSGYCGCRWCIHHGEKKGENSGIIYSVTKDNLNSGTNRSWKKMQPNFEKLARGEIALFDGVTGISILNKLPYFRWTTQIACDILHNLLEGLCKKILKNICSQYKKMIPIIDERIKSINTPSMYHRVVRSLEEAAKFKAIEYYMLFTYCKEVFENIVTSNQYEILCKIENFIKKIMHPINRSKTTKMDLVDDVFQMLKSVEEIFGEEDMTLAPHSVVHFPLSIWCLGPLYTNSTFMLEDLMGTLISSIHGGKTNMDHKALENWSIHQMTSLKRVRKFTFQYEKGMLTILNDISSNNNEKGDIVIISGQAFEIIKRQREGGLKLMKFSDRTIHQYDHLSGIDATPCFLVQGKLKQVYKNDLFLL